MSLGAAPTFRVGLGSTTSATVIPTFDLGTGSTQPTLSFGQPAPAESQPTLSTTVGPMSFSNVAVTSAPAPISSQPQLNFGLSTATQPTTAPTLTLSTSTTAAPPAQTGFTFGVGTGGGSLNLTNPVKPISTTAAAPTTTTASLGAPADGSVPTTQLTTTTTTTQSTTTNVSQMNFRQLQEAINKWMLDLQEQEKIFTDQATKVNAWDRTLITNGDKIAKLNGSVTKVKADHTRLEHALDYLKTQQQEFEAFLEQLEAGLPVSISVEPEREHLYSLTENVDTQLQQMTEDLKEVIRHINESNKTVDKNDPISQILRILNEHTDALQWVEDNGNSVRKSLDDVSKQHQMAKKEHERLLRMMSK